MLLQSAGRNRCDCYYIMVFIIKIRRLLQSKLLHIALAVWFGLPAYADVPVLAALPAPITHAVHMCGSSLAAPQLSDRPLFESIPSRPLALSEDGNLLFAVNTQANCLEIFDIRNDTTTLVSTVSVGVDPVAVAVRNSREVWVVNHLSDSVSVVDLAGVPHVRKILPVGDEPWDIVFADDQVNRSSKSTNRKNRAYISAAYRGHDHPQFDVDRLRTNTLNHPKNKKEPIGRADLWVYHIDDNDITELAGIINLFTDSIRSLAVNEDGSRVFAASFKSGNRSAVIEVGFNDLLTGKWSADGVGNPEPRLIVQKNGLKWRDENNRDWTHMIGFSIPDNDLFVINAAANLSVGSKEAPVFNRQAVLKTLKDIGTILFNIEYSKGYLFVSGIESNNTIVNEENLNTKFVKNFVTRIDTKKNYQKDRIFLDDISIANSSNGSENKIGLALPAGMSAEQDVLYVASMGGNKTVKLKFDDFTKTKNVLDKNDIIYFSKDNNRDAIGGPTGIVSDIKQHDLFTYTKFDNTISRHSLRNQNKNLTNTFRMFDGENNTLKLGRRYFYDATLTSKDGNVSCASCHIFGGSDRLQWDISKQNAPLEINTLDFIEHPDKEIPDLKTTIRAINYRMNPDDIKVGDTTVLGGQNIPVIFKGSKQDFANMLDAGKVDLKTSAIAFLQGAPDNRLYKYDLVSDESTWALVNTPFFHPLKGPMLTLPLYGVADSGAMHFRGDVQGNTRVNGRWCSSGRSVEERALKEFNKPCDNTVGTFEGLLGGKALDDSAMQTLADFILALSYPPNPVRPLNNDYTNRAGADIFFSEKTMADVADKTKIINRGPIIFRCVDCHTVDREKRQFGTSKKMYSAPALTLQDAKIPHLRFLYDRIGYFDNRYSKDNEDIHAAGFNHGGAYNEGMFFGTFIWLIADDKDAYTTRGGPSTRYTQVFDFLMGFDTNLYPLYGRQMMLTSVQLQNQGAINSFDEYVKNAYFPLNTAEPQCIIGSRGVKNDGSVDFYQIRKKDITDKNGNYSSAKRSNIVTAWADKDYLSQTLTCE